MLKEALDAIANCPQMKDAVAPLPSFDPKKASATLDQILQIIEENRIVPEDLLRRHFQFFAIF